MSRLIAIGAVCVLVGCGGGSSDPAPASTAPAATNAPSVALVPIHVAQAPAGTEVFLLGEPEGADLLGWAAAVLDSVELDADGRGELLADPAAQRALVRAPGKALAEFVWPPQGEWTLTPEARVSCRVVDAGGVLEAGALAIVFDAQGRPLPLPALELVAGPDGTLTLAGLPGGRFRLRVLSADAERAADLELDVAPGVQRSLEVTCAPGEAVAAFWASVDRELAGWVNGGQE